MNAPRTIAMMDDRSARHDLALVAVTVVGLSRLLEPPAIWLVAATLLGAMLFGTLQVLTDEVHPSQAWFGIPIESLQTAQFRHGPLELVGPGLAAIVIATEPETLEIDLALTEELARAGSRVLLVTADERSVPGARSIATARLDRAVCPAVSIVPIQLLAWRLAARHGREPGAYYRATKVTTHE